MELSITLSLAMDTAGLIVVSLALLPMLVGPQGKGRLKPRTRRLFTSAMLHVAALFMKLASALAVAGAVIVVWLVPASVGTYVAIALALLLMAGYRWAAGAPLRSIREWARRMSDAKAAGREQERRETAGLFLDFLLLLEQKLPAMQRRELAFVITQNKAALLSVLGRHEEALSILRSFDLIWDKSQSQRIQELMDTIEKRAAETGESAPAQQEPKEQA